MHGGEDTAQVDTLQTIMYMQDKALQTSRRCPEGYKKQNAGIRCSGDSRQPVGTMRLQAYTGTVQLGVLLLANPSTRSPSVEVPASTGCMAWAGPRKAQPSMIWDTQ